MFAPDCATAYSHIEGENPRPGMEDSKKIARLLENVDAVGMEELGRLVDLDPFLKF